jgi:hypothetical protein
MAVTSELNAVHRMLDELRTAVSSLRSRRFDLDAADLEGLVPVAAQPATQHDPAGMTVIDDRPINPSLWADVDDEGPGGYHR